MFSILIFLIFIPVVVMLNFQYRYSSLQCHVILQKSFWYADLLLKKHVLLISIIKTVVLLNIFCGIFFQDPLKNKKSK